MVPKGCCYSGCKNLPDGGVTTFYHFPIHHPSRCRKWIKNSNNHHLIHQYNSSSRLIEKYAICEAHFEPKDFVNFCGQKRQLLWNAIPIKYRSEEEPQQEASVLSSTDDEDDEFFNSGKSIEDNLMSYETVYLPSSAEGDIKSLLMAPSTSNCKPTQFNQFNQCCRCSYHDPLGEAKVYAANKLLCEQQQNITENSKETQTNLTVSDPFVGEFALEWNKIQDNNVKKTLKSEILLLIYNAIKKART